MAATWRDAGAVRSRGQGVSHVCGVFDVELLRLGGEGVPVFQVHPAHARGAIGARRAARHLGRGERCVR